MTKKVRLENIVQEGFSRSTGKPTQRVTEEFVCESCRHLVESSDSYCWYCGEKVEQSSLVEHWVGNKKLSDEQFSKARGLELELLKELLDKIPNVPVPNTIPTPERRFR